MHAHGQTFWTGTGSDDWNDSTSWSTGIIPTSSDDVYVGYNYGSTTFTNPGSLTLNITANSFANNLFSQSQLNLNSAATLTLGGNLMTSSTFSLAGTSSQTATLQFTNPATLSGRFLFSGQNGVIAGSTGTLNISASSFIDSTGTGTLQGTSILNQGLIGADNEGQMTLKPTTLDNIGFIYAAGSSTLNINSTSFQNTEGRIGVTGVSGMNISATTFNNVGGTIAVTDYSGLTVSGSSFLNAGSTISVTGNSSLSIFTNSFDNTGGTLWAQGNSTIQIGQASGYDNPLNITTAQLGKLRTEDTSQILLDAIIDNAGSTLDVTAAGPAGSVVLAGGAVLNDGKVAGALGFNQATAKDVEFLNSQTITGQLKITGTTQFDAPITIRGDLSIATSTGNLSSNVTMNGGRLEGLFTLNPGVILAGTGTLTGSTIVNQGSILANAGGTLDIEPTTFENEGTISVSNASTLQLGSTNINTSIDIGGHSISVTGGSTLNLGFGDEWSLDNTGGTISASGGSTVIINSTSTTAQLGTVQAADTSKIVLEGKINNNNNTLDLNSWAAAGSVELGGTVIGGKITGSQLFQNDPKGSAPVVQNVEFVSAQTLANVTLQVTDGAQFDGGVTLGSGSELDFTNSENLANNINLGGGAYLKIESGTLTVESGATIDGPYGTNITGVGDVLIQGSILADGSSNMSIESTALENQGTLGVGGSQVITSTANFTQDASGVLRFTLNSNSQYGKINFYGTASLNGSVAVSLASGYSPTVGTEWDILNFSKGYTGTLTAPTDYTLIYNTDSIDLELTTAPQIRAAITPEPQPFVVLAAGGLCLFFKRRRRK